MYTTRRRYTGYESFSGTGQTTGSSPSTLNVLFQVPTFLEGIYSWRTGQSNIADPPGSPPLRQKRSDGWGLITPKTSGSLVERLADRKRYIEDFSRMMIPAENNAGIASTNKTSTTDTGHPFGSMKVLRSSYRGTLNYYQSSTRRWNGDIWGSVSGNSTPNATPYSYGFPNESGSPLGVTELNRQAVANRYFAATAPDRKGASVGLALIELLRGDIPSLLKNFQQMMAGYKTVRNYVGSEGLNIMFGWTPLIQEYANVIKTGMALERVVYFESFRRKRSWDGPSLNTESSGVKSINMLNTPWNSASGPRPGGVQGPSSGVGVSYVEQVQTVAREDYHLSSKYTGLAKAGRRAESFSDQAMDVAKRMGVVDDPRLLWDLTPYSWLVDWFTTMGDSISNAQVYAPLTGKYTSDYAYMTTFQTYKSVGNLLRRSGNLPTGTLTHSMSSTHSELVTTSKWRARATPFGFGLQLGSLSASQFAVLVALGFAKTR